MQSMTVELDGRIAERTAHFAAKDAVASVDGRVSAAQAELDSIKDQVAALRGVRSHDVSGASSRSP